MRTNYCISVASIRQELKNDSGPLFSWLSNVNQTTDNSNIDPKTWLIVGASRGIGFIFVRLLLASGHRVVATARGPGSALDAVARDAPDRAIILTCDVSRKQSIASFIDQFVQSGVKKVHYAVINAGILGYPNGLDMTFDHFAQHLLTNAVRPLIVAQELLKLSDVSIKTMAFISSEKH
ncbi:hypothetical protein COH20_002969 [Aspergillus flavus]|uniref:Short-chain dehydrogenase n=1 Tax=Aspergillus flavus TaxID=5059 RepID=A0AB74CBN4_ASPFL|nr:hypothetical protein COH20_002969 [Aspergillus flavus]RAQ79044.1 hypothetical protein COH21_005326 [Aspergillus flavus]RMZ44053.1 hypothetical protein CA14_004436 [Aspergillus flavus]